jgi:hypothetical protein
MATTTQRWLMNIGATVEEGQDLAFNTSTLVDVCMSLTEQGPCGFLSLRANARVHLIEPDGRTAEAQ